MAEDNDEGWMLLQRKPITEDDLDRAIRAEDAATF